MTSRWRKLIAATLVTGLLVAMGLFARWQADEAGTARDHLVVARRGAEQQRDDLYRLLDGLIDREARPLSQSNNDATDAEKVRKLLALLPSLKPAGPSDPHTLDLSYARKHGDVLGLVDDRAGAAASYRHGIEAAPRIRNWFN